MSDLGNPSNPEPAITVDSRTLTFAFALPALVAVAASLGMVVFNDTPAIRNAFVAVASATIMVMLVQTGHRWRRRLVYEARFQGDYLWMRRGKDTLVVPLRYIASVRVQGGFLSPRRLWLDMTRPCSLGRQITLVPKWFPGDSFDRCIVAEQLEQRIRLANRLLPPMAAPDP